MRLSKGLEYLIQNQKIPKAKLETVVDLIPIPAAEQGSRVITHTGPRVIQVAGSRVKVIKRPRRKGQ